MPLAAGCEGALSGSASRDARGQRTGAVPSVSRSSGSLVAKLRGPESTPQV
jgi:hypothetical protein